jgi:TldD protein
VALAEKKRLLEGYNGEMLAVAGIVDTQASYHDEVTEYWYANSEGTLLHELRPEVTLSGTAIARRNATIEKGLESVGLRRGWNAVHDHAAGFREAGRRAAALLDAATVKGGTYPVVLDNEMAGVFIHEAFGHLSEADFVYENPQAREMMTLGRRFGRAVLNVGDNGAAPGLRGTLPYDDEGTPTQDTPLIQEGVLVGRLHSRETAAKLGERPTGNARAISYRHPPIVRMTNTYIANGQGSLQDLIRDIKLGVYACSAFGGQTVLENFSFTAAYGHMIRDGHLAELVKDVVLAGNLFQTLDRIERIGGDFRWNQMGGGCGKGGQFPLAHRHHVRIEAALVGATCRRDRTIDRRRARRRSDAQWHRTEHTSVVFESGIKACAVSEEASINLRVRRQGRSGSRARPLRTQVMCSIARPRRPPGRTVPLVFPPPHSPRPHVLPLSGGRVIDQLTAIGSACSVARAGCQVNVSVDRAAIETRLVNTAGVDAAYPGSAVSVSVDLARFAGDDVLMVYDFYTGTELPRAADLDALVGSIERRITAALRVVEPPQGSLPVVFTPAGLSAILLPLEQALSGKAVLQGISPLAGKVGQRLFDERFSIVDDPLVAGRVSSRPMDDEGVPSGALALVEAGVVRRFVYDLETAARAGTVSTGHGGAGPSPNRASDSRI